ncbi:MAG: DUF4065 domain-containing protein [Prevotellaceae bacterium]|jgi:uncharacterized phage-associated protein|nr:DUF4065 domain-containing protein [Prevotellaceae bacterium]
MNINAIAVANYFVGLANEKGVDLMQLGLMKRVYITHGFSLAILDKSALNPRFDVVEAWKNGPVIPSVYHSFKHNKNNPITEKSVVAEFMGGKIEYHTPELDESCHDVKEVAEAVFEKYINFSDVQMIELLHRSGTPWIRSFDTLRASK